MMKLRVKNMNLRGCLVFGFGFFGCAAIGLAQWSPIAPGLEYREYTLPGPVRVYIARADRQARTWVIDSMKGKGAMRFGKDTIPAMADLYQDTITFDGHRYDVKVAINGDYHDATTGPNGMPAITYLLDLRVPPVRRAPRAKGRRA